MSDGKLKGIWSSLPDRDNLSFEIWIGDDQIAEISFEDKFNPRIEFFESIIGYKIYLSEFVGFINKRYEDNV